MLRVETNKVGLKRLYRHGFRFGTHRSPSGTSEQVETSKGRMPIVCIRRNNWIFSSFGEIKKSLSGLHVDYANPTEIIYGLCRTLMFEKF